MPGATRARPSSRAGERARVRCSAGSNESATQRAYHGWYWSRIKKMSALSKSLGIAWT